jgi:hypothetical protein
MVWKEEAQRMSLIPDSSYFADIATKYLKQTRIEIYLL